MTNDKTESPAESLWVQVSVQIYLVYSSLELLELRERDRYVNRALNRMFIIRLQNKHTPTIFTRTLPYGAFLSDFWPLQQWRNVWNAFDFVQDSEICTMTNNSTRSEACRLFFKCDKYLVRQNNRLHELQIPNLIVLRSSGLDQRKCTVGDSSIVICTLACNQPLCTHCNSKSHRPVTSKLIQSFSIWACRSR